MAQLQVPPPTKVDRLQEILEGLPSVAKAYFQPPENIKMTYPCIVYERDYESSLFANNALYRHLDRYQLTVIDQDSESPILPELRRLPYVSFVRHFTEDDLHHDIFNLYF